MILVNCIVLLFILNTAMAAPLMDDAEAQIIEYENTIDPEGNYYFNFVTSNGLTRRESGKLVNAGTPDEYYFVQGIYTYPDPDGKVHRVIYSADDRGYHIMGPHKRPSSSVLVASLLG